MPSLEKKHLQSKSPSSCPVILPDVTVFRVGQAEILPLEFFKMADGGHLRCGPTRSSAVQSVNETINNLTK